MNATTLRLTLLLESGQRETFNADEPLIEQIRNVLANPPQPPVLVDLTISAEGERLLIPSDRIIGLKIEPIAAVLPAITIRPEKPVAEGPVGTPEPGVPDGVTPVRFVQLNNLLNSVDHAALLAFVERQAAQFVGTKTSTGAANYRESQVLYAFSPFDDLLREHIRRLLPTVCTALGIPLASGHAIEAQLTAHNDGNFYKTHNDNSSADTAHRALTFVYYFNRSPKAFKDGELVIFDHKNANGYHYAADTFKTVQPSDNSIVFFESREMHEVRPVLCPSQQFMDSRFTINGWIAKA